MLANNTYCSQRSFFILFAVNILQIAKSWVPRQPRISGGQKVSDINGKPMICLQCGHKDTRDGINRGHIWAKICTQAACTCTFTSGTDYGQNFGHITHVADAPVPMMVEVFGLAGVFGSAIQCACTACNFKKVSYQSYNIIPNQDSHGFNSLLLKSLRWKKIRTLFFAACTSTIIQGNGRPNKRATLWEEIY